MSYLGREVAKKVMGCRVLEHKYGNQAGSPLVDDGRRWYSCGCNGAPHDHDEEGPSMGTLKDYEGDERYAREVVDQMHSKIFSRRRRFLGCLQVFACLGKKHIIAWPDVLFFVTPEVICKAALVAVEEK